MVASAWRAMDYLEQACGTIRGVKLIGGLAVFVLLAGCSSAGTAASTFTTDTALPSIATATTDTPTDAPTAEAEVIYSVHSDGGFGQITYQTGSGQQQETAVTGTDWAKTLPAAGLTVPIVLAQNKGSGTITCSITYSDGTPTVTQTSSGPYSIVTCAGAVG
jgi:hypothetical protein